VSVLQEARCAIGARPSTTTRAARAINTDAEARLRKGGMTKGQKDDWIWILQNRRGDLAHERKVAMEEMWSHYDADDLRKMDRQFI